MPFTFSHPAAILPFLKLRRDAGWKASLLAGSLVPDLVRPLFALARGFSHSLPGLLLVDLPTGILLGWTIHRHLAPRLRRLPGLETESVAAPFAWAPAAAATFVGAGTHLLWDLVTHDTGNFGREKYLSTPLFDTPAGPFLVGHALWYVNTALGLLILASWLAWRLHRSPRGLGALVSGPWIRLLVLPALPFLLLFRGFHRATENVAIDLFNHVAYLGGGMPQRLLVPSILIGVAVLLRETRAPTPLREAA